MAPARPYRPMTSPASPPPAPGMWSPPCVSAAVGKACHDANVVCMMGALTPTEVFQAREAGAHLVKIFPASTVGPAHLKALRSVFPQVLFMPTGGVDAKSLGEWMKAGAACVGVGGRLVDENLIRQGDKASIIAVGHQLMEAYAATRTTEKKTSESVKPAPLRYPAWQGPSATPRPSRADAYAGSFRRRQQAVSTRFR